jgi:hypothetical protein
LKYKPAEITVLALARIIATARIIVTDSSAKIGRLKRSINAESHSGFDASIKKRAGSNPDP